MANRYATKAGDWSDTTVWDGGTLPQAGDVVRPNTFTVVIDMEIPACELRDDAEGAASAGGFFSLNVSGTYNLVADVTATDVSQPADQYVVRVLGTSSGTLNISGEIVNEGRGATYGAIGIISPAAVTINISTKLTAALGGNLTNCSTIRQLSANAVVNLLDTLEMEVVNGGAAAAVVLTTIGVLNVYVPQENYIDLRTNSQNPLISVSGGVVHLFVSYTGRTAGSPVVGSGFILLSTITDLHIHESQYAGAGANGGPAIGASSGPGNALFLYPGVELVGNHINGMPAVARIPPKIYISENNAIFVSTHTDGVPDPDSDGMLLWTHDSDENVDPADVRDGVVWAQGKREGTCHVPDPQYVLQGVPVDDTVGEYVPSGGVSEELEELIDAIKATTDRLDAMVEDEDGDRWTEHALSASTAGGGASVGEIEEALAPRFGAIEARLGAAVVEVTSPVVQDGTIRIVQGDDYLSIDGRAIVSAIDGAPDLTDATVTLRVSSGLDVEASSVDAGGETQTVTIEMTSEQTAALAAMAHGVWLVAELAGGSIVTLLVGRLIVAPRRAD